MEINLQGNSCSKLRVTILSIPTYFLKTNRRSIRMYYCSPYYAAILIIHLEHAFNITQHYASSNLTKETLEQRVKYVQN